VKYLSSYADEYVYTGTNQPEIEFNKSELSITNNYNLALWSGLYAVIYQCNALIEGVDQSSDLSETSKIIFRGEAKFLRAFANFYLLNLYDRIPLILTTEVNQNRSVAQVSGQLIYDQILKDLLAAKTELGTDYPGKGKVRANRFSASAL